VRRYQATDDDLGHADALQASAVLMIARQRTDAAVEFARTALAVHRSIFGDAHVVVAESRVRLSSILAMSDPLSAEALSLRLAAIEVYRKLPERELHAANVSAAIADSLAGSDAARAEPFAREAFAYMREVFGPSHPSARSAGRVLAHCLIQLTRLDEAEAVVRGFSDATPDHFSLAKLGEILILQGRHEEAENVLRECLGIREKTMPESWLRFNAMSLLGEALVGQREFEDAESLLLEAYGKMAPPARSAYRKTETLARIVALYEAWGKPDEAARWRNGSR
jgi:non-specific serine/threonine protein kinase/serine/threonine-protein kinase